MNLSEPVLKRRSDGSEPAKNVLLGNISDLFKFENSTCVHYGSCNQCYSVIKLLTSDSPILDDIKYDEVFSSLIKLYPNKEFLKDFVFFSKNKMKYEIVIIYDKCNWHQENTNNVLVVDFTLFEEENLGMINSIRVIKQIEFQKELVSKFGINRTRKPLIYSTTEFEGYLSDVSIVGCKRNDITLFPGDIDLVLYTNDNVLCNIFEFKKHTKFGGCSTIEDQTFMKYIAMDHKKYTGIANFTMALGKDFFFNIIYSTRIGEEHKIKIEKISVKEETLSLEWSKIVFFKNLIETKKEILMLLKL